MVLWIGPELLGFTLLLKVLPQAIEDVGALLWLQLEVVGQRYDFLKYKH